MSIIFFAKIEASNDNPVPFYDPIISRTPSNLTSSGESNFFFKEVDAFLAVEDEPISSQFPQSYLDPEGDILLLEAFLNDDHSSDFKTKSSSTSLNSFLENTNNFYNSLPESDTLCFDVEEISSGSTTTRSDISLPEYEASYDDQSCSDEDVLEKIVSKPLFEEEIIPMKIDLHPDNAESALMESLRTHDSSLLISSKIDSLLDEFVGELTLLKLIPPGIDETDCDFEEDIHLIKKLLYDNSSPHPSKEFVSVNSDAKIKSFSPSPILVKDSDSLMEEIDLFCTPNYTMPPGIEDDDYDSEKDILIHKDLPNNNTLSFAEKESFHFDIPPFSRPPTKPPDDDEERSDSLDDNIIYGLPPFSAVTPNEPVLSTEEPDNSLRMGDEHLDTIPETKSNKFIKSGVENLIPIPSESEGIPGHACDVPSYDNSPPLDVSKDQFEDLSESNNEVSSIDDDSFSIDNIDYVEASPPDSELFSSEVMEIVIPETKSSSTSLHSLLEETNTFDNSLLEFETFCFDVEEISSGSTTTHPDTSLPEYEAFHDDHVKEISNGSPTTHSDSSLYASFIFDLSINPLPSADRSDFYEFTDELIAFISPPEYDCFLFKVEPNSRDFTKDVVKDISPIKEPQVHNTLPTHPTLQLNMKFQPSSKYLFTYVVWIFLPFLVYSVASHYLLSLRNEDTIFDPGICNSRFSRPDVSHRCGTFPRLKILLESPMEIFSSTCSPMDNEFGVESGSRLG
nr:hypothetical protein [Tanacetum cinerariifolium]